jgi:O-antigen ligase
LSAHRTTVTSSITSTALGGRIAPTLLGALALVAAFLSGGFFESTYSLLAAAVWLGVAASAALRPPPRPSLAFWLLAALLAWTSLSAPLGPALRTAPLVALYAGVVLVAERADAVALLRTTWTACVAVSIAALVGWIAGVGDRERLEWPVTYTNGLGLVAVLGALLSLQAGLPRRAALGGAAACTLTAVFTFSRSALLAGAVGALVYLAATRRVPRAVAVGGAAAAVLLAVVLAQPLASRFAAPAPDEGDLRRLLDVTGHGRAELWRVAAETWLEHPLTGSGAGTYARELVAETGDLASPANAHSLHLEMLAERGPLGLALVLAFVAAVLARRPRFPAASAAFAAWAVHAGVDWDWQLPAATIPALMAAAALLPRDRPRLAPAAALAFAVVALAVGVGAGLHGVAAALLETGDGSRTTALLLPHDARPAVARGDLARACEVDAGELALRRHPSFGGCQRS